MPTILINTNLIKSTSAVKTGECCGGNDEEQQRQCLDEEFRQDLNEIIKKLLVKSETMESFTIKYDIDDLKSSSNEADKTKTNNESVSRKKACICHRMARLFSDLLSNENDEEEDKTSKKKPSQCGDETDEGAGRHLESIYHEIKLLRKYQVDLDTKFNLLLTKLTYNQQEVGVGGGAGSGNNNVKQNRQLQTRHHPIPNNNRSTTANHQSQQQQLNNVNSNLVRMNNSINSGNKLVNDNHLTLTGAKKRKLNSSNSFGQSNMNNIMKNKSRSPSNSSSSTSTTTSRASSAVGDESGNSSNKPQQTVELPPAKKQSDGSGKETSFNTSNTSSSAQMKTSPSSSMSSSSAASSSSSSTVPAVAAAAARKGDEIDDVNVKEEEENELDEEEIGVSDQENENDEEDDEDDECLQLAAQGFSNHDDDDVEFVDNDIIDDYEDQEESNGLNNNNNNEEEDDEDDEANFYGDGSKFQPNFQSLKFNNRVGNKQPLSVAVQNHLKSTTGQSTTPPNVAAAYLNYVYQQQQQQQQHSQHNSKQLNHNHHHNSNHHQHNRDIFNHSSNLLSQQQQPHLSHTNAKNNYFNSASYQLPSSHHHHHNHHQTSINSLSSMSSGNANLMLKTSPGACSPLGSSLSQQQQQQQALNQSIDIDINELFKGNGPKYLQLESYKNFKPPISKGSDGAYYVEDTMAALSYSKSKSRRNFAAHLTKLVFTPRERLESNCNGRFGKKALDPVRLLAIRNTIFKYYPCKQSTVIVNGDSITSGDSDENSVWVRDCIPAIDESNRVLKKQLVAWYKKNNPDKFPAGYKMECSFSTGGNGANTASNATGGAFLEPDLDEFDEQD